MPSYTDILADVPSASNMFILVDFDGTLSNIVSTPSQAEPVAGAEDALERIAAQAMVAVVSGRPIIDLRRRIKTPDGVILAGGHGAEVCRDGHTIESLVDVEAVTPVLDQVERELHEVINVGLGWLIERKPASIAVHHRMVADPGATLFKVRRCLDGHVDDGPGFVVSDGKAVTELRPRGVTKGVVVDTLSAERPELHLLVIGDDVTDEDAFLAANARGGTTVLVAEEPRQTAAMHRIADPAQAVELLRALADR